MADESSIIINIHAQSDIDEATKQVAEMLQAARDLAASSGKLQQANNTLSTSFQQEAGSANKSVQALRDATKQENMLQQASASMRTELRKVSQQLQELAATGDTSSKSFLLLADRAAQMTDTMGDVQSIVNILASDTKKLDTAIGVGAGLTGAFSAATSAAALLGGESEALNEAFLKVQAAMSIINGIQQVAAVMDKRSAANVVLRTALTKLFVKAKTEEATATGASAVASGADAAAKTAEAAATTAATTATTAFTAALLANPVMWIVAGVAALVGGIVALTRHFKKSAEEARGFANGLDDVKTSMDRINDNADYEARLAEAEGRNWRTVAAIRQRGMQEALDKAKEEYDRMVEEEKKANGKISEEERKHMDELAKIIDDGYKSIEKLEQDFHIREIREEREAEERRIAQAREYAKKRRAAIIEQYELEALERDILERTANNRPAPTKKPDYSDLEEEEEVEDIINPDTYREAMALRMELEGATEDEIFQYRYNSLKRWLQLQLSMTEEGSQKWLELNNQLTELEIENAARVADANIEKYKQAMDMAQEALSFISDMTNEVFGIMNDQISAQLDNLHEMYTTDAAEAAKDEKKKYITKEEYDKKERDLKIKQAKLDKANAAFQIAMSTAMAIMRIWADVPKVDFGASTIALTAMAAALGSVQLAAALAKPLPQYAKGRKGGKGEYAIVGERGAEIMYVPDGASIIPHNKINDPASWGAFGVPSLPMPAMPNTDRDIMMALAVMQATGQIDYDKMGAALAKHMPQQKAVSVNIDRNGIMVSNGHDTHTYLNAKYSGAW